MKYKITLSYSVLDEYRKCGLAFYHRYVLGLTRPPSDDIVAGSPLLFGTYVHYFLEHYHGTPDALIESILADTLNAAAQTSLGKVDPGNLRSLLHLELLLSKYFKYYERTIDFTPYYPQKKSFEVENDFPLWSGEIAGHQVEITWRQHYDGIVMFQGSPVILEHKTSSGDLRKELMERMLPNDQAVGYVYGATKHLGIPIKGVLFNGLATYRPLVNPGYTPRDKTKDAQPLFLRHLVNIEPWMLEEWETRTIKAAKRLVEDVLTNSYDADPPNSCTVFNSRCKFADICKVDPASREIVKDVGYLIEKWRGFELIEIQS